MTVQSEDTHLTDDSGGKESDSGRILKRFSTNYGWLALICVSAFLIRYFYIQSLEHLLCQFGDAYFFLAGASKLRELVCNCLQSGNLNFFSALPPASPNGMVALGSIAVSDRLMVDGPVFPCYLAIVQWIVGLAPGSLLFDSKALQISTVHAVLDSITCCFIFLGTRRAFGRKAAYIAATLFAIYPPSIINTQSCYTEPFGCFILTLWSWLILAVFGHKEKAAGGRVPLYIALGIATAILALTRPPFVFLPVGFCILLAVLRLWQSKMAQPSMRALAPVILFLAGVLIVLLPWLMFTHKVTGHYSLTVNRVPAFNLYLGNQLHRDGWRAYPFPEDIPETVGAAAKQIIVQAAAEPAAFLSLELRKIPRLWAGTWNEFQYSVYGIPLAAQEMFHQVLLSLALLALLILITKRETLKEKDAAVSLLITIFAVHFLYLAFEPIARYNMTATPAIFMLAGSLIATLSARPKTLAAFLVTLLALVATMNAAQMTIAFCAMYVGGESIYILAAAMYVLVLCLSFVCFDRLLNRLGIGWRSLSWALGIFCLSIAALTTICITSNPEMREWKTTLSLPNEMLIQEITLPPLDLNQKQKHHGMSAYLLLDLAQGQFPAPLRLSLNGTDLGAVAATPWLQVHPNPDFLKVLLLQEKAMGVSLYSFRQWWVVPLPPTLIKYGAINTVTIASLDGAPLTVFGDYNAAQPTKPSLPSLSLASWTKAFCTYDHHDPRIYESVTTAQVHSALYAQKDRASDDLSSEAGKQFGQYRIHLITVPTDGEEAKDQARSADSNRAASVVVTEAQEHLIAGDNPSTMQLASKDISIPPGSGALAFTVNCQLKSPGSSKSAFIGVEFDGTDARGASKKWTSIWQPASIETDKNWTPFYLSDSLPDDVLHLHNLKVSVTVCPFHPDFLLLHQKQAIRSKVLIRNLTLSLSPGIKQLVAPAVTVY